MANYILNITTTVDQEDALTQKAIETKDTNLNALNAQINLMFNTLVSDRKTVLVEDLQNNSLTSLENAVAQGPQVQPVSQEIL